MDQATRCCQLLHNCRTSCTTTLHTSNGPLSGTTQVSRYQKRKTNLNFTEARDSEWQWHQLGHIQVCSSLQTDSHASTPPLSFFYRLDALPAAQPTALKHCTTNPQQIEVMELDGYSWLTCSKQPRCINHKHEHQRVSLTTWSTCCGENFLWPEFGTKFQREVPLFSGTQISL